MRKALIHLLIFSLLLSQFLIQVHAVEHPFHAGKQDSHELPPQLVHVSASGHEEHEPLIDVSFCDELSALEKASSSIIDVPVVLVQSSADVIDADELLEPNHFLLVCSNPAIRAPPYCS